MTITDDPYQFYALQPYLTSTQGTSTMPKIITTTVYTYAELIQMLKDNTVSSKAVERAADWLREGQRNFFDSEYTIDLWKGALEQIGFIDPDIQWSGFSSQGDGACFSVAGIDADVLTQFLIDTIEPNECIEMGCTGKDENYRPWLIHAIDGKNAYPEFGKLLFLIESGDLYDYCIERRGDSRYLHENTKQFSACLNDSPCRSAQGKIIGSSTPRVRALFDKWVEVIEDLRRELCQAIYKSLNDEWDYVQSNEVIAEHAEANGYTFDIYGNREG